jgi:hypothetical protein
MSVQSVAEWERWDGDEKLYQVKNGLGNLHIYLGEYTKHALYLKAVEYFIIFFCNAWKE